MSKKSSAPSASPSSSPTSQPSQAPTSEPSSGPTDSPTTAPSELPSPQPTIPPTAIPTVEAFPDIPVNDVPNPRYQGYFNYNLNDRQFGPNGWRGINMDGTYFREFGQDGFGTWKGYLQGHVSDSTNNIAESVANKVPWI